VAEGLIKTAAKGESRLGRVARFLVLLGTEEAAKVLRHLPEEEVDRIVAEIARTEDLSANEARRVLAEFGYRSTQETGHRQGGRERAREILTLAFGKERGEQLLSRSAPVTPQERFSFLQDLEPHQVEHLLRKESTHVRAMVMAHLAPSLAAQVLARLPDEEKRAVTIRLARMSELAPEVTERVAELLKERIRKDGVPVTEELDGAERLAEILRYMQPGEESSLLESLRDGNEDIAEEVEQRLYSIDIIHELPDDQLERVLRRVDDQEIALLLKGKAEVFRSKMLRNLSERRQRIVVDEYHNLGPVRRRDVEQANRDFVELLKQLAEEGEIVATWRGDDYT
jgi:flagellar motor switch protein FliG